MNIERRDFLKIIGAVTGSVAVAGCFPKEVHAPTLQNEVINKLLPLSDYFGGSELKSVQSIANIDLDKSGVNLDKVNDAINRSDLFPSGADIVAGAAILSDGINEQSIVLVARKDGRPLEVQTSTGQVYESPFAFYTESSEVAFIPAGEGELDSIGRILPVFYIPDANSTNKFRLSFGVEEADGKIHETLAIVKRDDAKNTTTYTDPYSNQSLTYIGNQTVIDKFSGIKMASHTQIEATSTSTVTDEPTQTPTAEATQTATATATPTNTRTPESTPTPIIETITFTTTDGKEITMPEFQTIGNALKYISENAKWRTGDRFTALDKWLVTPEAYAFFGDIKKISGWSPEFSATSPDKGKEFVLIFAANLSNGITVIFEGENANFKSLYINRKWGSDEVINFDVPTPQP